MKSTLTFLVCWLAAAAFSVAQIIDTPTEAGRLKMTQDGGANGAAIAYDPTRQLYYTAIAGNASFPLEVFRVNDPSSPVFSGTTSADLRGLWINPKTHALEGNAYGEGGIVKFELDRDGYPVGSRVVVSGDTKPDEQGVGTIHRKGKHILYFADNIVFRYKRSNGKASGSTELKISTTGQINYTTLFYFGEKDAEYGVLDVTGRRVLMFDVNGAYVTAVKLPVKFEPAEMFNCSYANKRVWIFNKERREWVGYQVFK